MNDWEDLEISELCTEIIDCVNKTAPSVDEATPYKMIRTPNVRHGYINLSDAKSVTADVFEKWSRGGRQVRQNDVILTREAPLGDVGIFQSNELAFLGQRTVLYRPNLNKCDPFFLTYSLLGPDLQNQISALGSGATVAHMRVPDAKKLIVKTPPLQLQRKIGSIFKCFHELVETNDQRITVLEEMARRIYREWFVDFKFPGHEKVKMVDSGHPDFGMIPEGWEVCCLEDIADIKMGQSPPSSTYTDEKVGLPFHQGVGTFGELFPKFEKYCSAPNKVAQTGDILLSVRAPVGRINLADQELCIGRGLSSIRHKKEMQSFLTFQLKEIFKIEDSMGSGSIFNSITAADLKRLELLAPISELEENFNDFSSTIVAQLFNLCSQSECLKNLRDLLLPKLINGEIDVSNLHIEDVQESISDNAFSVSNESSTLQAQAGGRN